MFVLFVTLQVKPERRQAFIEATMGDARGANNDEPGCLRFDVLQDTEDEHKFYYYEVYKDEAGRMAHRQTPHYIKWRDTVRDWYAAEITRVVASPVYPPEGSWRKRRTRV